jgi:hypothetical protein
MLASPMTSTVVASRSIVVLAMSLATSASLDFHGGEFA